jgi:regulatory protein YycI of two-component signal transduction system YycFG
MVIVTGKGGKLWNYPTKVQELVLIEKNVKDDFNKICKEKKINKSKLIEEFYRTLILRFKQDTINQSGGYVSMNILREPIISRRHHRYPLSR